MRWGETEQRQVAGEARGGMADNISSRWWWVVSQRDRRAGGMVVEQCETAR